MKIHHIAVVLASVLCATSALRVAAEQSAVVLGNALHRDGQQEDYPSYGITFTGPRGWDRVPEGAVNRIARWVQTGTDGKIKAMMMIEHTKLDVRSMDQEAKAIGAKITLKSLRGIKVDGEPGIIAQGTAQNSMVQLFEAFRGNVKYVTTIQRAMTNASDTVSQEDADLMNTFVDNWKWRDLEEPYEHVTFMDKALPVLKGQMCINVPLTARPDTVQSPDTQLQFAMINLKRQSDEFRMVVTLKDSAGAAADLDGGKLKEKLGLAEEPQFEKLSGNARISRWVKSAVAKGPTWMAFSVVNVDADHTAVASFVTDRAEDSVQRGYMDIAKKVTLSIGPG